MTKEKPINVIMPVYILNERTLVLTENAIMSLGKPEDIFLVIVDNASTCGVDYLKDRADDYIQNKENLGYAKAVNQGIRSFIDSPQKLIAIANNDIRVSPNWREVTRRVLKDPEIYSCHFRMTDYEIPFKYGRRIVKTGMERWCTGSFFVIDITDGPFFFDERFFNSYDDWDYSYRVREQGLFTTYTDMACYQHHHSWTQQQIPEREENDKKNAEYFKEKHGNYAEDLFKNMYPDQMEMDYLGGFNL